MKIWKLFVLILILVIGLNGGENILFKVNGDINPEVLEAIEPSRDIDL